MAEQNNDNTTQDNTGGEQKRRRGRPTKADQLARRRAELEKKGEQLRASDSIEDTLNDINPQELEEELHKHHGLGIKKPEANQVDNVSHPVNNDVQQGVSGQTGNDDSIPEPKYEEDYSGQSYDPAEVIPEVEYDPLQEKVVKRGYTQQSSVGPQPNQQSQSSAQTGTSQSTNTQDTQSQTAPPVAEEVIPEFTAPVNNAPPDPNLNGGAVASGNNNTKESSSKNSFNDKLEDLSPGQKRKAAEKTADALLLAYGQLLPIIPKKISSVSMNKLKTLEIQDKLTLSMQIMEDGTTIKDYFEGVNQQVEDTFVVTDEMKNEVREPLIEVLLENNLALTPAQRLLMAVGGHVVAMGMATIEFASNNKAALREFKKFHEETKRARAAANEEPVSQQSSVKQEETKQEHVRPATNTKATQEEKVYEEVKEENNVGMDEVLEHGKGGITIEEEPNNG